MPASSETATGLSVLIAGYRLCAQTEGKSKKTIAAVTSSVTYVERFLRSEGLPIDIAEIGHNEIRSFIFHLQQKKRFSDHPFARPQETGLSGHTINCYLRSIRAFWSWLISEGIAMETPFARVKIPKAPRKVVPTLSAPQLEALLGAIDSSTPEGFRDYAMILTLFDTGLRVSELTGLRLDHVWLEDGTLKVMGKGGKERLIPIGKAVQRLLWKYITDFRPEPTNPNRDFVFLTADGRPITRNRIEKRMALYGDRADLRGVRCSPHTLRHTAAVSFLRNGGDVFSLQRLLGHSTLAMTRHYCELADIDVQRAHATASPVDNLPRWLGPRKPTVRNTIARNRIQRDASQAESTNRSKEDTHCFSVKNDSVAACQTM
ncbi:tyrosine-type recombinase/integrase [Chloroflexota bacterium]